MITSEVKTANKKFRIYRPDITLEDICRINGPSIVRKMIPCFDFPDVVRDDEYEMKIITRGKNKGTYRKELIKGNNSFESPRFTFVYGVNVRTPRVKSILPFSTTYVYDKTAQRGRLMDKDVSFHKKLEGINLKVPDFTDKYRIRELIVYATVKQGTNGGCIDPKDIIVLSLSTEEQLKLEQFRELKEDLCLSDGFFLKQVNALGIQERAYLWLTSEDYNVNQAGTALSNIIAISDDYDAIAKDIKPRKLEFIDLLFLIKARHLFDTEIAQRKTAIASAKAAIMSRNMSHNLGSHVMAYLKQHLSSVQDMVRDNVLALLFSPQDILTPQGLKEWYDRYEKSAIKQKEVALPFLVGLGKFISYLQERQDFIATIATDYVPYFSSVNFKDFIYDELNPDLRYERHKDRIGLQPDNILLGNIARSEGLARSTNPTINKKMADIIIKYRTFNGKAVKTGDPRKKDLDDMRDFMIHLPGGVVGRQAIFSIVENVIRNAAKHGKWIDGGGDNLELTFDRYYIEDFKKGLITNDYVPSGELPFREFFKVYYAGAVDINDLCVITLTDNISFESKGSKSRNCDNLHSIRKALIEPYIDNSSVEMLQTNKGIKEMRISAAWMRGIEDDVKINPLYITKDFDRKGKKDKEDHWIQVKPEKPAKPDSPAKDATPEELEQYRDDFRKYEEALSKFKEECKSFEFKYWKNGQWINRAPVLMVRACAEKPDEDFHLQYVFCLPKPKAVAVILSEEKYCSLQRSNTLIPIKDWFSQNAWGLYTVDSFSAEKNKSYEFIIISEEIDSDGIDTIMRVSPKRVFRQKQVESIISIDDTLLSTSFYGFNTVLSKLYEILCVYDPINDIIVISDEKVAEKGIGNEKPDNVHIKDGEFKGRYLYRTHNETEQKFTEYLKNADEHTCFVEGITGNNSTDRLVRNDRIDQLWLYKQLHAMKTSVGIFDERIFSKIYKKDEADIRLVQLPFDALKKQLRETSKDDETKNRIRASKTEDELNKAIGRNAREILGDYMSIAFEKKGVSVFNLFKTKEGLDIYGFDCIVWDQNCKKCYGKITKVGDIRFKEGCFVINNPRELRFDYQTIHQGLLDKVYEQFGIRHDPLAKHMFTKAFYESFSKDSSFIGYKDDLIKKDGKSQTVFFLPNLRIHSGRSKPSFADMPQHQPFIQYAAIEHAVMDCKYSLIELLDSARYE